MGEKLLKFYEEARTIGGLEAQIRLALITKMSSAKAKIAEDSPEHIKLFEDAFNKIRNFEV